ncbi:hypothetical protein M407DRAFT_29630 [Tulasnella calospora MUT 4182]|uniref:Uncharacterized protein n=1 Tax=Tulasnella calospora MUT 4182 TaxID=1051891 RepID=A0A0C3PZ66_9AGAM|nr:hypothetical protein M407DRAFT_29630 [Tulasnella calospora MUT 4182]
MSADQYVREKPEDRNRDSLVEKRDGKNARKGHTTPVFTTFLAIDKLQQENCRNSQLRS